MITPFFSVVIPLFNKAPYVERAVRSVLRQSFTDFEIIVVDDGSRDGGGAVVQALSDARITLLTQSNSGASAARKRGVSASSGRHVAFLDADDEWDFAFLEEMAALIRDFPNCGIYASGYQIIEGDGRVLTVRNRFEPQEWRGIVENYFRNVAGRNLIVCSSAVVVPRENLGEEGFLEGLDIMGEDQYLWSTIALEHRVAYTQRILAVYHRDVMGYFASIGPLKESPCYVPMLADVVRTGRFRGRPIATRSLRQIRRYISESLLQLAIINARAGDFRTAFCFIRDKRAGAKPIRRAAAAAFLLLRELRSPLAAAAK